MSIQNHDLKLKKCFKSYLTAKKYFDIDNDKSYEYLKQCIKIMNDIKHVSFDNNLTEIINETENECCKYIRLAIEKTINKPLNRYSGEINNSELFDIIEKGDINKLKQFKYGEINFNVYNDLGLTPLHYAIKFGDITFLKYAFKLGGHIDQTNKFGHTLLEYACLEKDPNIINFLTLYGSDMKKHLMFREDKKYFNNSSEIDIVLLQKIIMNIEPIKQISDLLFIFEYIDQNEIIELEIANPNNNTSSLCKIKFIELVKRLEYLLNNLHNDYKNTYINIIKDELSFNLEYKLGCPNNKIHILLYNLLPFIEYGNIKLTWVLSLEIKFIILNILKNKTKINIKQLKEELAIKLKESYLNIIPEGLIQIIVQQWFIKINV